MSEIPPIIQAAFDNNLELVKQLHSEAHDLSQVYPKKVYRDREMYSSPFTTVMLLACMHGNIEMLRYTREHGCSFELQYPITAAENGQLDCLKWLISQGCRYGFPELHNYAISNGHLEVFKWLTSKEFNGPVYPGPPGHNDVSVFEINPRCLFWAIKSGRVEAVQYVDSQLEPKFDWSREPGAASWACVKGYIDILYYIISKSGDLSVSGYNAVRNNQFECFAVCFKHATDKQLFWNMLDESIDEEQRDGFIGSFRENILQCLNAIDLDAELWRELFYVNLIDCGELIQQLHIRVQQKLMELHESKQVCREVVPRWIHRDIAANLVVSYV